MSENTRVCADDQILILQQGQLLAGKSVADRFKTTVPVTVFVVAGYGINA